MNKPQILGIITLLILLGIPQTFALDYWLDSAGGIYTIGQEGEVGVQETIVFGFRGNLNYIYKDVVYDSAGGEEIWVEGVYLVTGEHTVPEIWEMGNPEKGMAELDYLVSEIDGGRRIKVLFDGEYVDDYYCLVFVYELKGVVEKWSDVGQFYRKVWSGWEKDLPLYQGKIVLPSEVSAEDVYTWGHPEKDGMIRMLDSRTIGFEAYGIDRGEWLEIRAVFPAEVVGDMFVMGKEGKGLEKIVEEEENYGKMSNQGYFYIVLILGGIILFLGTLIRKWWREGRDPKIEYNAEYERDIPYDYSPAIVSGLLNEDKKPSPNAILGVIMDLSFRGFLKIQKIQKKRKILFVNWDSEDYKIEFIKKKGLTRQEEMIYELLEKTSKDGRTTSFKEIEEYFNEDIWKKSNQKKNKIWMKNWQDEVQKEIKNMGLSKKPKLTTKEVFLMFTGGLVSFVSFLFFGAIILNEISFMLFFAGALIVLVIGTIIYTLINSRTKEGVLHYKKWKNLEKFLKDYSLIKEKPPESIVIWEKYLIYAVALGCADKVAKAMELILPEKDMRGSYIFIGAVSPSFYSGFSGFGNSFSTALASGTGTAGSGGFGGGGGGAGGGGGGGAG